jgi:ribosomal-protein-alanine N-acetyltransferase
MLTINFDPFPVLFTERLLLRQISHDDANEIFVLRSDKRVMQYIARPLAKTVEDAHELIEKNISLVKNNEAILWAITLKDVPALIGTICYWNIEPENYRAELGYMLHPDYQGKGIMQETLTAVLDYGFRKLALHSIVAIVDPENAASIKLLERNNFEREGYFKESCFFDGKFLDSVFYSILNPGSVKGNAL